MSRIKFERLMADLPKNVRSSAKTVGASYQLFENAKVRFSYFPADSSDKTDPLCEVMRVVLDEKLCLYFYKETGDSVYWTYDGFESGDYANPEPEGLEFRVIE